MVMVTESDGARPARDRDAFLTPRPHHASEEEVEAAQRELSRELVERGWRRLMEAVEEEGEYPSPEYLADLVAESVPEFAAEWARDYLKGRLTGEIAQPGQPLPRPDNLHVPDHALYSSTGGVPPERVGEGPQAFAVWQFRRRWARYRAFETRNRPRPGNRHRTWKSEASGVWKVREPKRQALKAVAPKYSVSPSTLEKWHRQVSDDYGADVT